MRLWIETEEAHVHAVADIKGWKIVPDSDNPAPPPRSPKFLAAYDEGRVVICSTAEQAESVRRLIDADED